MFQFKACMESYYLLACLRFMLLIRLTDCQLIAIEARFVVLKFTTCTKLVDLMTSGCHWTKFSSMSSGFPCSTVRSNITKFVVVFLFNQDLLALNMLFFPQFRQLLQGEDLISQLAKNFSAFKQFSAIPLQSENFLNLLTRFAGISKKYRRTSCIISREKYKKSITHTKFS